MFVRIVIRIANREDQDQTASSDAVRSGSALFVNFVSLDLCRALVKSV